MLNKVSEYELSISPAIICFIKLSGLQNESYKETMQQRKLLKENIKHGACCKDTFTRGQTLGSRISQWESATITSPGSFSISVPRIYRYYKGNWFFQKQSTFFCLFHQLPFFIWVTFFVSNMNFSIYAKHSPLIHKKKYLQQVMVLSAKYNKIDFSSKRFMKILLINILEPL